MGMKTAELRCFVHSGPNITERVIEFRLKRRNIILNILIEKCMIDEEPMKMSESLNPELLSLVLLSGFC